MSGCINAYCLSILLSTRLCGHHLDADLRRGFQSMALVAVLTATWYKIKSPGILSPRQAKPQYPMPGYDIDHNLTCQGRVTTSFSPNMLSVHVCLHVGHGRKTKHTTTSSLTTEAPLADDLVHHNSFCYLCCQSSYVRASTSDIRMIIVHPFT